MKTLHRLSAPSGLGRAPVRADTFDDILSFVLQGRQLIMHIDTSNCEVQPGSDDIQGLWGDAYVSSFQPLCVHSVRHG